MVIGKQKAVFINEMRDLLEHQRLAVLSTHDQGVPHASLVAFCAGEDLTWIAFATLRSTRKYSNLKAEPRAALLIDSRTNRESDFRTARALTAKGCVEEAGEGDLLRIIPLYLSKHPQLEDFVKSPSCALMVMRVESYDLVERFQNVMEVCVTP
ncbi:MAG: pyridoxamine 5'-phosphate oxidase family protein [Deltaproteobacteria bacterium]|nr:pyridoxamine 5'-phosphate oxidase family protein [Deltaproteobacteria bacterium]